MNWLEIIWAKVMAVIYMWTRRKTDRPGWQVEKKELAEEVKKVMPQLKLVRKWFTDNTTIGDLFIDGTWKCYILEDKFRDPDGSGNTEADEKIMHHTAIPYGTYEIIISYSNRFKKHLPLLLNVPHFKGIRMHPGNDKDDTSGCLLPGIDKTEDNKAVTYSRKTFQDLFEVLKIMCAHEKVKIHITNERMEDERTASNA